MKIVLIGFAACYKSSVGKLLSTSLSLPFVDTDLQVESFFGKSISQIFSQQGESVFRNAEDTILQSLLGSNVVVSCGGGLPLSDKFGDFCRNAVVVWLTATPQTVHSRLGNPPRPLFDGQSVEFLQQKMTERSPVYSRFATCVFSTDGKTPNEVAEDILNYLNLHGRIYK